MFTRFSGPPNRRLVALTAMMALLCGGALGVWAAGSDTSGVATEIRITDDGVQLLKNGKRVDDKGVRVTLDKKGAVVDVPGDKDGGSAPEPPEPPGYPDGMHDSNANDIVKFGTDVTIRPDRKVDGSVVVIGGSITVYGEVMGDAVSIGGDVNVRGSGRVHGDAVAVGGAVNEDAGSAVSGENVSIGIGALRLLPIVGVLAGIGSILGAIALFFVLLVIAGIALVLARERMDGMQEVYRHEMGKAVVYGGILTLLLGPVCVLLMITIIGIPVALILLLLAFPLAVLAGIVSSGIYLGRQIRPGLSTGWAAVAGLGALVALQWISGLLSHVPVIGLIGTVLGLVGALGWIWAFFAGLGAIWLTRFGNPLRVGKIRDTFMPPMGGAGTTAAAGATVPPSPPPSAPLSVTPAVWTPPAPRSSSFEQLPPAGPIITPVPPADPPVPPHPDGGD